MIPTVLVLYCRPNPETWLGYTSPFVTFWCPYCRRWHTHGALSDELEIGRDLGHRVAHCFDPKSPYDRSGYHLVVGGKLPRYKAGMPRRRPNIDLILKYGWY